MAISFFKTIDEFRLYVRGVDASTKIEELAPDFNSAKPFVFNIIEQTLWDDILAYHTGTDRTNAKKNILMEYIQIALANFTQKERFPMQSALDTTKDMYKYQVDAVMDKYRLNGYNALNDIINYLDAEQLTFTDWPSTQTYIERAELIVSDYKEFDRIYSIDGSSYFFVRTMFLQKEVINDEILTRIGSWTDINTPVDGETEKNAIKTEIVTAVKRALVYYTMYLAIKRFDILNLPESIRKSVTNEQTKTIRTGYNESADAGSIAAEIFAKARKYFNSIENGMRKLNLVGSTDDTELEPNQNDVDNKFYYPGI
jgi:hypothetical protein